MSDDWTFTDPVTGLYLDGYELYLARVEAGEVPGPPLSRDDYELRAAAAHGIILH